MKILIVSQRFWPENFRINDIASTLVQDGHSVSVLTGLPNYPKGYIYPGYKYCYDVIERHNGIEINRVKEIERKNNIISRFLNYYSFLYYANKEVKNLDKDFDVILVNSSSPIMSAIPAIKYKEKYGTKVVMYCMDLWPESLLAGGIKKNSLIYKYYKKVSSKIYSSMDKILVSTKEHIGYIKSLKGCNKLDIDYLPQYAEEVFENVKWNPEKKQINLIFAGNIGKAQSIDTIIKAANILNDDERFIFNFYGNGSALEEVIKLSKSLGLNNAKFNDYVPVESIAEVYSKMSVGLVTLENSAYANVTIPGKVQSYMAAGLPIIGAVSGSTNTLIKELAIGECVEAEDFINLAKIIKELDSDKLKMFSSNEKKYYSELFTKNIFISKLENYLSK